jgi:hypothetical protein
MSVDERWDMVQQYEEERKARPAPKTVLHALKKKPVDGKKVEELFMDLRNEGSDWADEFLEAGGVDCLSKLLDDHMTKKCV